MIPYIGCEYAREHLEAFVDGELAVTEQVAVESHLRWCRTCAARVEDVRLIGDSIRSGSPAQPLDREETRVVSELPAHVLMRIRTERELSFPSRLRDMFTDMRLFWPAVGATAAVLLCVGVAFSVLLLATRERPESLAAMIDTLSNPGSDRNPMKPGNTAYYNTLFGRYIDSDRAGGISIPRVLDDGSMFEGMGNEDAMFAVAAVVTRDGRVSNYEVLSSERMGEGEPMHAKEMAKMLHVVRQSRFEPAQTSLGRTVAVDMVWLMVITTVQTPPAPRAAATVRVTPAVVQPPAEIRAPEVLDAPPIKRSERAVDSTTA